MRSVDYKYVARQVLKGHWVISAIVFVAALILGGASGGGISFTFNHDFDNFAKGLVNQWYYTGQVSSLFKYIFGILSVNIVIITILRFIIGSFVELGYSLYNIKLVLKDESMGFTTLFDRVGQLVDGLLLRAIRGALIFLWSLLFVIPGIIASYNYALSPYIMAENPGIPPMEALHLSKKLMYGHRWDMFCLQLSFIGWVLLVSIFSFGIGMVVVCPYFKAAETAMYLDICGRLNYNERTYVY